MQVFFQFSLKNRNTSRKAPINVMIYSQAFLRYFFEIIRQFGSEFNIFIGFWMNKTDFSCMKALSFKINFFILYAIHLITRHGMTYISHMHSDLMSTTCFKLAFYMCVTFIPCYYRIMSNRIFAVVLFDKHIFFLSLGFLPIGASTVPSSSFRLPNTIDSYSLVKECSLICSARER